MARYYTRFEGDPSLVIIYRDLQAAALAFGVNSPQRARAAIALYDELRRRLTLQATRSATRADELIRDRIERTRVRPRASGRMAAHVRSEPLATSFPSGAIGVANLDTLDKSNPSATMGRTGVPYWMAQEYGSTAAVGRIVPGYFQPGNARPSQAEFRVHPYFQQEGPPAPRGTPAMVIQRPIRGRHFLRDGAADALLVHKRQRRAIDQFAARGIRTI